jgi:hypothetical protein
MERFAKGKTNRNELFQEYRDRLKQNGREIQEAAPVRTDIGSFYYQLLYATRKTGGDNGYMDVVEYVGEFLERVDSADVDRMLEVLDGDQSAIEEYIPDADESVEREIPDKEESHQSGLGEFTQE